MSYVATSQAKEHKLRQRGKAKKMAANYPTIRGQNGVSQYLHEIRQFPMLERDFGAMACRLAN
jgi:hypothetical protein